MGKHVGDYKQVFVIRSDLKMRRGKEIAQASHAAVRLALHMAHNQPEVLQGWFKQGETKVCLHVKSEESLLAIYQQARDAGLPAYLVADAGLTEFGGVMTHTCVGIGPALKDEVDKVTGGLTLY